MADSEKAKKQVPLRISASLWNDLSQWAEDEFRSINGQIEYLLTECAEGPVNRKPAALEAAGFFALTCMETWGIMGEIRREEARS